MDESDGQGFFFPSEASTGGETKEGQGQDAAPKNTEPQVQFLDQPSGDEPNYALWLWFLYFNPRRFFRQFVVEPMPFLTVLCAWIYGMAGVINQVKLNHVQGSPLTSVMTWTGYLGAITGLGVLGGAMFFLVGGWWYRARLIWSGVEDADIGLARRIYLCASMVAAIPIVLATIGQSTTFATPAEMMDAGTPIAVGIAGAIMFFLLWSVWTSYRGVVTVFANKISRVRASMWFLILPGMFHSTVFAMAFAAGVFMAMAQVTEPPDLDNPEAFRGSLVRFGYPGNWDVEPTRPRTNGMFSIRVLAEQDAMLAVEIYHSKVLPEEELALVVTGLQNRFGGWRDEFLASRWGTMKGVGVRATADIDGDPYRFTVLIVQLAHGRYMEIRQVVLVRHEEAASPGFDLIKRSFKVSRRLFE